MSKQFEIVFVKNGATIAADLLEDKAPLSCEALWNGLDEPEFEDGIHGTDV